MGGRRGVPRRKSGRSQKTRAQQILTDYMLTAPTADFQSLGAGAELKVTLLDNSQDFGNVPVRVVKMKAASMWNSNVVDERRVVQSVYREKEGATALKLDVEADVKNATQAGQFYRRPHLIHTNIQAFGVAGEMDHFRKPLILRNLLLDDDDDVSISWTNIDSAFSANAQYIVFRVEAFWKRV